MCSKHIPYQFVRNGSSLGIAVRWYHPQPHTCSRATTAGRCHVPMGAQQSRPSRAPPTNTDKEMYERLIAIQQQLVAAHAGRADEATLTLTLGRGAAGDARGAHDSSARISPAASPATCRSSAPTATHKNLLRCSSRRARAGPLLARPPYPIINICIRAVVASAPFGTVL